MPTITTAAPTAVTVTVHRIEVSPKPGQPDPQAATALRVLQQADAARAPKSLETARVYLIEGNLKPADVKRIANELLTDPVTQQNTIGTRHAASDAIVEIHPLPGVMDPDAEAVEQAVHAMLEVEVSVQTGWRYDMQGISQTDAVELAGRNLANPVIHKVVDEPYHPQAFPHGSKYELRLIDVSLRGLNDKQLTDLSRSAHLFLSLEEMKTIQAHYQKLGRDPREIELETLAQTWSEHCVHKTLKSRVVYSETNADADPQRPPIAMGGRPGHTLNPDGSVTIDNLLKSTVAAATHELMADGIDWCLSVFVDNAGIIAFDENNAVCFKAETHNHPSAIEPYGGAATGIGGCIRDIIGTGLGAKPIANTDVFCVAYPDGWSDGDNNTKSAQLLPTGVLHPRRILSQVVAGVRDYGNRMGIPTLNGTVWFDENYLGNPLVFCGCIGVMPRDKIKGDPQKGDHIVLLGGRTGRDGIHGATFSSAELTDTHADEFSHAVQIGNAVTEKKMLDAVLAARDAESGCLYHAITDCGAGGLSSAVGEMGEKLGAEVHLERVPLKYAGLSPTEIWISEAQERVVLAVPAENINALKEICELHEVDCSDLGTFGTPGNVLILRYRSTEVGRLDMHFMHEGIPQTTRQAVWSSPVPAPRETASGKSSSPTIQDALLQLLAHPNIASKHWIIRQYDHEVQGRTVLKPLVGKHGVGPGDAAVIRPVANSARGLAIANGLATNYSDDPYIMALMAIDECVRNLVCVGADPDRIAILDNFCWPGCDDPQRMAGLVRATEGCYDGAKAFRTPFISGKDSLNNQFTTEDGRTIRIPPTLLISGFGIVPDVAKCITMDAKRAGNLFVLVGATQPWLINSHYAKLFSDEGQDAQPKIDLTLGPKIARCVHAMINEGLIQSAHDGSDGGFLVSAAEMCIGGGLGLDLQPLAEHLAQYPIHPAKALFGESASTYLLEVQESDVAAIEAMIAKHQLSIETMAVVGRFTDTGRFALNGHIDASIEQLQSAWRGTLDW